MSYQDSQPYRGLVFASNEKSVHLSFLDLSKRLYPEGFYSVFSPLNQEGYRRIRNANNGLKFDVAVIDTIGENLDIAFFSAYTLIQSLTLMAAIILTTENIETQEKNIRKKIELIGKQQKQYGTNPVQISLISVDSKDDIGDDVLTQIQQMATGTCTIDNQIIISHKRKLNKPTDNPNTERRRYIDRLIAAINNSNLVRK